MKKSDKRRVPVSPDDARKFLEVAAVYRDVLRHPLVQRVIGAFARKDTT